MTQLLHGIYEILLPFRNHMKIKTLGIFNCSLYDQYIYVGSEFESQYSRIL